MYRIANRNDWRDFLGYAHRLPADLSKHACAMYLAIRISLIYITMPVIIWVYPRGVLREVWVLCEFLSMLTSVIASYKVLESASYNVGQVRTRVHDVDD